MTVPVGTMLGPYRTLEKLGEGGMGEVYKASDTRLDRVVAVKVLPPHWADNAERKERFEREAQTIASLNHPHICVLHDVGQQDPSTGSGPAHSAGSGHAISFLVMEFLDGETLARRLERGPLDLDEALRVAIAIADALDKAHRSGVVHRDLKPSNVMLTGSGPKLLDFGLAKLKKAASGSDSGKARSPYGDLTTPGAILGTLQYMAPEQIEGMEADARTDIFAFGTLVHEMVTGKKAFQGKSRVLLMSAIATSDTEPLSRSQPAVPAALEHVVKTCLAKDPKDRWQTARDLLAELQWIAGGGAEVAAAVPAGAGLRKRRILYVALAASALLAAGTAWPASLYLLGPRGAEEFRIRMPLAYSSRPGNGILIATRDGSFALSPDGRSIAYVTASPIVGTNNNNAGDLTPDYQLFVRTITAVTPRPLAGTEGARQPFWSADGSSIAFFAGGWLKKVEKDGGVPQNICQAADAYGGTWNADGTILFGTPKGLFRVSVQDGKAEPLTTTSGTETGHLWPQFLPGGRRYLYVAWSNEPARRGLFAGTLGSKDRTKIATAESRAAYAEPGVLVFQHEANVMAQRVDPASLAPSGNPVRVADTVATSASGGGSFSVSPGGVLAYYQDPTGTGGAATGAFDELDRQLAWTDRAGQTEEIPQTAAPRRRYRGLALAPDGSERIAVHSHDGAGGDIFVVDPKGNAFRRITQDASRDNSSPVWSPDGKWIAYASLQKGKWGLYRMLADAPGTEQLLYESELPKAPMSWVGKHIVFWVQDPKTNGDIWVLDLSDDKDMKATPLFNEASDESHPQVSPDGHWIAFASNRNTGRSEIWVKPFPAVSETSYQVSFLGGDWPRWRSDSRELYFSSIGVGTIFNGAIGAVTINTTPGGVLKPESPREIFLWTPLNPAHAGGPYHVYDVSPDGKQFLTFEYVLPGAGATTASTATAPFDPDPAVGLVIAFNWASSLKR